MRERKKQFVGKPYILIRKTTLYTNLDVGGNLIILVLLLMRWFSILFSIFGRLVVRDVD